MDRLFIERIKKIAGGSYDMVLESFELDKLPNFRVNTLVVDEKKGIERLEDLGFSVISVKELENAYLLENRTKREFTDLEEYTNGWYYLQSLSSMVPVLSIAEEIKDHTQLHVLDMCAAPGSKTSQMAGIMQNTGQIDAYDISRQRIFQMKSVLKQLFVSNVLIHQGDASNIWRKYGPVFDVVLLDAVCSGEGRFRSSDIITNLEWNIKKVQKMAEIQRRLIFSAIMCLKPGGLLVYSTCTFSPEENEEIIDFALKKFEGAIEIERINLKADSFREGLVEWNGKLLDSRVSNSIRILGDVNWDGFFVCKIRRN